MTSCNLFQFFLIFQNTTVSLETRNPFLLFVVSFLAKNKQLLDTLASPFIFTD